MAFSFNINNDANRTGTYSANGQELGRISQGIGPTQFAQQTGYYDRLAGNTPGNNITLDLVPNDQNIKAFSSGKVISVGENGGWGGQVKVLGDDGRVYQYSHLRNFNVSPDQRIEAGQVLGLLGGGASDPMRGTSTGRHLDFGILQDGKYINPIDVLSAQTAKPTTASSQKLSKDQFIQKYIGDSQFRSFFQQGSRAQKQVLSREQFVQNYLGNPQFRQTIQGQISQKSQPLSRDQFVQKYIADAQFRQGFKQTSAKPQSSNSGDFGKITGAIVGQESGGNYAAIGPAISGRADRALGKYQIMGANLPSWSSRYLGRQVSQQEFINNPQIQDQIATGKLKELYENGIAKGLKGEDIARYVATSWYAGQGTADKRVQNGKFVYTQTDLNPQAIVGGSAPSIKRYGDEVLNRIT